MQEQPTNENTATKLNAPPPQKENDKKEITKILTQNIRGLPSTDDTKLKSILHQMKTHGLDAACFQETWRMGNDDFHIDGYHIFFHGVQRRQTREDV